MTDQDWMLTVAVWVLLGSVTGLIALRKGRSGITWFGVGVLLGPLGLLLAALLDVKRDTAWLVVAGVAALVVIAGVLNPDLVYWVMPRR